MYSMTRMSVHGNIDVPNTYAPLPSLVELSKQLETYTLLHVGSSSRPEIEQLKKLQFQWFDEFVDEKPRILLHLEEMLDCQTWQNYLGGEDWPRPSWLIKCNRERTQEGGEWAIVDIPDLSAEESALLIAIVKDRNPTTVQQFPAKPYQDALREVCSELEKARQYQKALQGLFDCLNRDGTSVVG